MSKVCNLAVIGSGPMADKHVAAIRNSQSANLLAAVKIGGDFNDVRHLAGVPTLESVEELLAQLRPDGIVVSIPDEDKQDILLKIIDAGIPILIEPPIGSDKDDGSYIACEAYTKNVPILASHPWRFDAMVLAAKQQIVQRKIGTVTAATGFEWTSPRDTADQPATDLHFKTPILASQYRDIDILRHLVGEAETVDGLLARDDSIAEASHACSLILRFQNGGVASLSYSEVKHTTRSGDLIDQGPRINIGGTLGTISLIPSTTHSSSGKTRHSLNP